MYIPIWLIALVVGVWLYFRLRNWMRTTANTPDAPLSIEQLWELGYRKKVQVFEYSHINDDSAAF